MCRICIDTSVCAAYASAWPDLARHSTQPGGANGAKARRRGEEGWGCGRGVLGCVCVCGICIEGRASTARPGPARPGLLINPAPPEGRKRYEGRRAGRGVRACGIWGVVCGGGAGEEREGWCVHECTCVAYVLTRARPQRPGNRSGREARMFIFCVFFLCVFVCAHARAEGAVGGGDVGNVGKMTKGVFGGEGGGEWAGWESEVCAGVQR